MGCGIGKGDTMKGKPLAMMVVSVVAIGALLSACGAEVTPTPSRMPLNIPTSTHAPTPTPTIPPASVPTPSPTALSTAMATPTPTVTLESASGLLPTPTLTPRPTAIPEPIQEPTPSPVPPPNTPSATPKPPDDRGVENDTKEPANADGMEESELGDAEESGEVIQLAKQDLAKRLGTAPEQIAVISVESVDWPDTSLGVPKQGVFYAQVITPGYKIVLTTEGKRYEYHTDHQRVILVD